MFTLFIEYEDTMQVVWHNHEYIQFNRWEMLWNLSPATFDIFAEPGEQYNIILGDVAEQMQSLMRKNRHEICA